MKTLLRLGLTLLPLLLSPLSLRAGSATWNASPVNGDWDTAANWTPMTVPNSNKDTATFDASNITDITTSLVATTARIVFNPGASAYTITSRASFELMIAGAGIQNDSGTTQNFVCSNEKFFANVNALEFTNRSSAGIDTAFTVKGGTAAAALGGALVFQQESRGGEAAITVEGPAEAGAGQGHVTFGFAANAARCTVTNMGGTISGNPGGEVDFVFFSTGGSATVTNGGGTVPGALGGRTAFTGNSDGGNATIICNGGVDFGGSVEFQGDSTGGNVRVEIFDNGVLGISNHNAPGVTIGSLEGNGLVSLGSNNLTVGANNLSTNFAGAISGTGSLIKTGSGRLILSGRSTYIGGTTINEGSLILAAGNGSATGQGPVQVNTGMLGGRGKISGAVTIGNGGEEAALAPGKGKGPATLSVQDSLTLNPSSHYKVDISSAKAKADEVVAAGVTINPGAVVDLSDADGTVLPAGTVFTIIGNTAATPIAGVFANLADGATVPVGSNNFQVSYEGGDGNDLSLTVVP
jgi:autotransporter-associated beta strand protein